MLAHCGSTYCHNTLRRETSAMVWMRGALWHGGLRKTKRDISINTGAETPLGIAVRDGPLNASHAALRVNFLECWEWDKGKVQHFSWVTDLRVNKGTVYQLMRGGRARWRIENETFNTLKNQGYHFEHNFGHGYQHLSVVFAVLLLLAFFVDQVQQLCCPLFQVAWAKWGSKRLLWEKMRALFYAYALTSMRHLFEALWYGWQKTAPIWVDSS